MYWNVWYIDRKTIFYPCCAFIDGQCERRLQTNGELKFHLRRWEILPIPVIEEAHKTFFTQCRRSFQGIHVGAGYAGWHQLGRGFRCAHGNRCDSWFHETHPVAIENTQNFRHLTNSRLKILVSKLFISTGEVLRYANVVLPHTESWGSPLHFSFFMLPLQCWQPDTKLYFRFCLQSREAWFQLDKGKLSSLSLASGPQCNHRPGGPDGCRTVVMWTVVPLQVPLLTTHCS